MYGYLNDLSILQEQARIHFDCPSIIGVEIENQGGGGTASSHWEQRIIGVSNYTPGCVQKTIRTLLMKNKCSYFTCLTKVLSIATTSLIFWGI